MKTTKIFSLHETGMRDNNEDYTVRVNDHCFIVCDGMGGHENGEVASRAVCESFVATLRDVNPEYFDQKMFEGALTVAYNALDKEDSSLNRTMPGNKKMGTTLAFLYLNHRQALMAHIGDSRIYHIRKSETGETSILYKSSDHSFVNDLIKSGMITEEEAARHPKRNVITRVMQPNTGKRYEAHIEITRDVKANDRFFLCTDGILESVDDRRLCNLISENADNEAIIKAIFDLCKENSRDNFSAWLVSVQEGVKGVAPDIDTKKKINEEITVNPPKPPHLRPVRKWLLVCCVAVLFFLFHTLKVCVRIEKRKNMPNIMQYEPTQEEIDKVKQESIKQFINEYENRNQN